jgi:hypothetical protein
LPRGRLGIAWNVTTIAAAITGTWWLTGWLAATGLLALWSLSVFRVPGRHHDKPTYATSGHRFVAIGVVALAVLTPILARLDGTAEVLSVLGLVAGYDAAAYVVGTGAMNRWEGPAAGVATVLAGFLAVAALADPPFTAFTAFLLTVIVCVAGPLGPTVARRIAPHNEEEDATEAAPSLRRLSTLLAAGPALLVLLGAMRLF